MLSEGPRPQYAANRDCNITKVNPTCKLVHPNAISDSYQYFSAWRLFDIITSFTVQASFSFLVI